MKNPSRRFHRVEAIVFIASALSAQELPQVDGTTGAPLGGIGTGAVKFCGNNGNLSFCDVAPVKCGNNGASFVGLKGSYFELYSSRGGSLATKSKLVAFATKAAMRKRTKESVYV